MAQFLVDKLENNKCLGMTYNIDKFMHNLQIVGVSYYNDFLEKLNNVNDNGIVELCTVGRYITLIQLSKDKKKGQMIFIDLQNDYDNALQAVSILKKLPNKDIYIEQYMQEFMKLRQHYEENYSAAELILDVSGMN